MSKKYRLDYLVAQKHPELSRTQLQSVIMQGKVLVNNQVVTKPGMQVSEEAELITNFSLPKYASRAGLKLEAALDHFAIDPTNLIILDAGLSTGGFTDCLLQRSAQRVYGVDVGHGQVAEKIRQDERVVVMEQTNLRHLEFLPEKIDLATLDLSFISLTKVLDAVVNLLQPNGRVICLIKPQFEAKRHEVRRGGLVSDPEVHQRVQEEVVAYAAQLGLQQLGPIIPSPIQGNTSGNIEFLGGFEK
ncbi:MAG: TlyA family RNA methyltransferase [Candidatus Dependentiae bacterium]|jgi:23S rRNA (cytidine1920-2'-O)/16S rRNA (cytidine1409-2'-O)-methyltransferase